MDTQDRKATISTPDVIAVQPPLFPIQLTGPAHSGLSQVQAEDIIYEGPSPTQRDLLIGLY